MGENASRRVMEQFTWERLAREMLASFEATRAGRHQGSKMQKIVID
jgi:hypothetical protein